MIYYNKVGEYMKKNTKSSKNAKDKKIITNFIFVTAILFFLYLGITISPLFFLLALILYLIDRKIIILSSAKNKKSMNKEDEEIEKEWKKSMNLGIVLLIYIVVFIVSTVFIINYIAKAGETISPYIVNNCS